MHDELEFRAENFTGPLDLLLTLIKKSKLDIYDVLICDLADQFFEFATNMGDVDLEFASEFLAIASELFEIKSRMLLPFYDEYGYNEFDEDPRVELIQRLVEYQEVIQKRQILEERYDDFEGRYFREEPISTKFLESKEFFKSKLEAGQTQDDVKLATQSDFDVEQSYDTDMLIDALKRTLDKMPQIDTLRQKFFEKMRTDVVQISVEQRACEILEQLHKLSKSENQKMDFEYLIEQNNQIIPTFLAILQLMKDGKLSATQNKEHIWISIRN